MKSVVPLNYKIALEPDLVRFNFRGRVEILLEAVEPVNEISLNSLELEIHSCQASIDTGFMDCLFRVEPKKQRLRISLPKKLAGKILLRIEYEGLINDKMVGFYRSGYITGGKKKHIAVTQFQESDARRAFPCFDHPVKKATFDVEMILKEGLAAISNGPVVEQKRLDGGKRIIKFHQTPKMSTYLLFFGVGQFEFIEDSKDVVVRVATTPGMTEYARFGLDFGRKSLEFCDDYYRIKYPLPKLDLIAIPDFAFGAMENWGAITFRENLLLHYPGITSRAGEERICEVIAHEIAHQWFGNLVSPSDWKYVWLNESFATYFSYGIVSHYRPEWGIWDQFLQNQTEEALERDALQETIPIELPGKGRVAINASTAPILYNKGGSILRQVERYVGRDSFRDALRSYLREHKYGCASSHHLWEALEGASEKPITKMMKSWIEQTGFPIVDVERHGEKLILRQGRFTYIPNKSKQRWLIPVTIRFFYDDGDSKSTTTLLEKGSEQIDIDTEAVGYLVNDGRNGFYRVKYHDRNTHRDLGNKVLNKTLSTEDRWGLQNDLYALVKRGDVSIDEYLDFSSSYRNENAFLPLTSIASNLFELFLVVEDINKERVASIGKSLFERVLTEIGLDPKPDEKHTVSLLRDRIIWHAVLYGSREVETFTLEKFESLISGDAVHQDILKSVVRVGALNGQADAFAWFDQKLQSSQSEHERMNILIALGCFRDGASIQKAQQYVLNKVPSRNRFIPIASLASNPHAVNHMWDWYVSNLAELEQFHPMHFERVIEAIVPLAGIGREEEVRAFFKHYTTKKKMARDVIKLSLERLEIHSRMRNRTKLTAARPEQLV
jgi:tricorn protease interacting factor F2/3